jgi:hypothetical protein
MWHATQTPEVQLFVSSMISGGQFKIYENLHLPQKNHAKTQYLLLLEKYTFNLQCEGLMVNILHYGFNEYCYIAFGASPLTVENL